MKKLFILFAIVLSLYTLSSCNHNADSVPSKIIPKDKMADVLVDVHLAEAAGDNRGLNTSQINMLMAEKYDTLFQKHGTTFAQFKVSYDYYISHPDQLSEIYVQVINKLTTIESKITQGRKIKPPIERRDSVLHH